MSDEDKQKLEELEERIEQIEKVLNGIFHDLRDRADEYQGHDSWR